MSDELEGAVAVLDETTETETKGPRSRPKFTLDRDEAVYEVLTGAHARQDLAAHFGTNVNLVYLSLHRLREAGRVKKVRIGKQHLWARAEFEVPAPAEAPAEG